MESPFTVKNCCPIPLQFQIGSTNNYQDNQFIFELKPQETKYETRISSNTSIYLRAITTGFEWSASILLHSIDMKDKCNDQFIMLDENGCPLILYIYNNIHENSPKRFYIYCKICIINETPFDLLYFSIDDKKITKSCGQFLSTKSGAYGGNVILINEVSGLAISAREEYKGVSQDVKGISQEIIISGVGDYAIEVECPSKKICFELGVSINIQPCGNIFIIIMILNFYE